jgi:hypothetical protein
VLILYFNYFNSHNPNTAVWLHVRTSVTEPAFNMFLWWRPADDGHAKVGTCSRHVVKCQVMLVVNCALLGLKAAWSVYCRNMNNIKVHLLLYWKLRLQTSTTTSLYRLKLNCFPHPLQVNCEILRRSRTKLIHFTPLTIWISPAILSFCIQY